jgi:hypothetical protein
MLFRRHSHLVLSIAGPLLLSCQSPTSVSETADLAVAGGESHHIAYINAANDASSGTAPFTLGALVASAYDFSRRTGYFTALAGSGRELLAVDLTAAALTWRVPIIDIAHPVTYNGIQLAGDPMGLTPDNTSLIMGARRNDTSGIATFVVATRTVGVFRGPLDVLGLSGLPASGTIAAMVKTGTRPGGGVTNSLVILDPTDLHTLDSIALPAPHQDPLNVVEAPGGDRIYLANEGRLYLYSRQQRTVLASVLRPALGDVAVSPDGQLVVLSDHGTFPEDPGSGKLYVFNALLESQRVIDLASASLVGNPVVTSQLSFSRDGRWLFVAAGTTSIGPLYGAQRARVLVIDTATLQLVRAIPLNDWGFVRLFPMH